MVVWVLAAEQRVPVPGQSGQGPRVSTGVASAGPSFSQMFFTRPRTWRTWFSGRAMGPACLSSSNHSLFPQCLWCFLDPKESKRWARGSLVSQAPGHFHWTCTFTPHPEPLSPRGLPGDHAVHRAQKRWVGGHITTYQAFALLPNSVGREHLPAPLIWGVTAGLPWLAGCEQTHSSPHAP